MIVLTVPDPLTERGGLVLDKTGVRVEKHKQITAVRLPPTVPKVPVYSAKIVVGQPVYRSASESGTDQK